MPINADRCHTIDKQDCLFEVSTDEPYQCTEIIEHEMRVDLPLQHKQISFGRFDNLLLPLLRYLLLLSNQLFDKYIECVECNNDSQQEHIEEHILPIPFKRIKQQIHLYLQGCNWNGTQEVKSQRNERKKLVGCIKVHPFLIN